MQNLQENLYKKTVVFEGPMGYSLRSTITAALLKLIHMHDGQFNVTSWVGNVLRKRKIHIFQISDAARLFADLLHDHETF